MIKNLLIIKCSGKIMQEGNRLNNADLMLSDDIRWDVTYMKTRKDDYSRIAVPEVMGENTDKTVFCLSTD